MHGLIGPNGREDDDAECHLRLLCAAGRRAFWARGRCHTARRRRGRLGIARTFQTPRVIGEASVLQNVMIGGTIEGQASFVEALLTLPRSGRDERAGGQSARALAWSGWKPGRCPRGPAAAQRTALHRDRARADASIRHFCCWTSRLPGFRPTRSSAWPD